MNDLRLHWLLRWGVDTWLYGLSRVDVADWLANWLLLVDRLLVDRLLLVDLSSWDWLVLLRVCIGDLFGALGKLTWLVVRIDGRIGGVGEVSVELADVGEIELPANANSKADRP